MPEGVEETVPEPDPDLATVRVNVETVLNVAVTDLAWSMDTTHVPVPEHPAPDQPVNAEPDEAEAARVTGIPGE